MSYHHAGSREYASLCLLLEGKILNLGGLKFRKKKGEIEPGDFYIAERNTGPKFLECKYIKDGYVVPTTFDYPYDLIECVRVEEVA